MIDRKVVFFPVESNAAQLEAMRSGRVHVTWFQWINRLLYYAGFVPFGMMAYDDGSFGYEIEIIVKEVTSHRLQTLKVEQWHLTHLIRFKHHLLF